MSSIQVNFLSLCRRIFELFFLIISLNKITQFYFIYFRSKDELIELVSEEEFYKEAPENISRSVHIQKFYLVIITRI